MRHKHLVFDLDGTLYPHSSGLEDESDARCQKYFEENLGFSSKESKQAVEGLRQKYTYDSEGVEKDYGISTKDYLEYICDVDPTPLKPNPEFEKLARSWAGKKFILTDSTKTHVQKVLARLKVGEDLFADIFDSEAAGFSYKYQDSMFEKFFAAENTSGAETIFFDDKEENLKKGKKFGMTTVWISENPKPQSGAVDYQFKTINDALKFLLKT